MFKEKTRLACMLSNKQHVGAKKGRKVGTRMRMEVSAVLSKRRLQVPACRFQAPAGIFGTEHGTVSASSQ
jgi:hypothetical protein